MTLSHNLYGVFKQFHITNYLNGFTNVDRIIVQIDSIEKIMQENSFADELEIKSYDLIIMDECESLLHHMDSKFIDDKEHIFNFITSLIHNCKKLIALDGDYGNRSHKFFQQFDKNPIVLENLVKKNLRHFILTNKRCAFEQQIDDDLKAGKNIVIASMSSTICTYFYNKYKDIYKCVCHCSDSDDSIKECLQDVANYWIKFQLLCYSPSIESGVSFDVPHFNRTYAVLSNQSTSPRGLFQMLSRCRKLSDSKITIYMNNLPFKKQANFFKYDEVKDWMCNFKRSFIKKTFAINEEGKRVIKYVDVMNPFVENLIYNKLENINKKPAYFVPYFITMLTEKGHTYECTDYKFDKSNFVKSSIKKDELANCKLMSHDEFVEAYKRQAMNKATHDDKISVEKYMYHHNWGLVNPDADFFDKYYGKTQVLFNLRHFLN